MRALSALIVAAVTLSSTALAADYGGSVAYRGGAAHPYDSVPAERREVPWTGRVPACDDPAVLSRIRERFASTEARYWSSSLNITSFEHIRSLGYRPWGASYIPRRFCEARSRTSDGRKRTVYYSVREDLGLAGWGWSVEWCVSGLDRSYAYDRHCRAARP